MGCAPSRFQSKILTSDDQYSLYHQVGPASVQPVSLTLQHALTQSAPQSTERMDHSKRSMASSTSLSALPPPLPTTNNLGIISQSTSLFTSNGTQLHDMGGAAESPPQKQRSYSVDDSNKNAIGDDHGDHISVPRTSISNSVAKNGFLEANRLRIDVPNSHHSELSHSETTKPSDGRGSCRSMIRLPSTLQRTSNLSENGDRSAKHPKLSGNSNRKVTRAQSEATLLGDVQNRRKSELSLDDDLINTFVDEHVDSDLADAHLMTEQHRKEKKLKTFAKQCSRIVDGVYVAGDEVARDEKLLKDAGITFVINTAADVVRNYFEHRPTSLNVGVSDGSMDDTVASPCNYSKTFTLPYLSMFLRDTMQEEIGPWFFLVVDIIEGVRRTGGRVLIHCHQGVSRSSTLALAYVMWARGLGWKQALDFAKLRRGTISPNAGFLCQLMEWQAWLHLRWPKIGVGTFKQHCSICTPDPSWARIFSESTGKLCTYDKFMTAGRSSPSSKGPKPSLDDDDTSTSASDLNDENAAFSPVHLWRHAEICHDTISSYLAYAKASVVKQGEHEMGFSMNETLSGGTCYAPTPSLFRIVRLRRAAVLSLALPPEHHTQWNDASIHSIVEHLSSILKQTQSQHLSLSQSLKFKLNYTLQQCRSDMDRHRAIPSETALESNGVFVVVLPSGLSAEVSSNGHEAEGTRLNVLNESGSQCTHNGNSLFDKVETVYGSLQGSPRPSDDHSDMERIAAQCSNIALIWVGRDARASDDVESMIAAAVAEVQRWRRLVHINTFSPSVCHQHTENGDLPGSKVQTDSKLSDNNVPVIYQDSDEDNHLKKWLQRLQEEARLLKGSSVSPGQNSDTSRARSSSSLDTLHRSPHARPSSMKVDHPPLPPTGSVEAQPPLNCQLKTLRISNIGVAQAIQQRGIKAFDEYAPQHTALGAVTIRDATPLTTARPSQVPSTSSNHIDHGSGSDDSSHKLSAGNLRTARTRDGIATQRGYEENHGQSNDTQTIRPQQPVKDLSMLESIDVAASRNEPKIGLYRISVPTDLITRLRSASCNEISDLLQLVESERLVDYDYEDLIASQIHVLMSMTTDKESQSGSIPTLWIWYSAQTSRDEIEVPQCLLEKLTETATSQIMVSEAPPRNKLKKGWEQKSVAERLAALICYRTIDKVYHIEESYSCTFKYQLASSGQEPSEFWTTFEAGL